MATGGVGRTRAEFGHVSGVGGDRDPAMAPGRGRAASPGAAGHRTELQRDLRAWRAPDRRRDAVRRRPAQRWALCRAAVLSAGSTWSTQAAGHGPGTVVVAVAGRGVPGPQRCPRPRRPIQRYARRGCWHWPPMTGRRYGFAEFIHPERATGADGAVKSISPPSTAMPGAHWPSCTPVRPPTATTRILLPPATSSCRSTPKRCSRRVRSGCSGPNRSNSQPNSRCSLFRPARQRPGPGTVLDRRVAAELGG